MVHRKYKDIHKTIDSTEYKQCKDCLSWFEMNLENFNVVNKNKDGFNDRCKACQTLYQEKYYQKNRETQIEKSKESQRNNKERASAVQKAWKDEHRDWLHEDNKRWRASVQEHLSEYQSNYRKSENGKEKCRIYNQKRRNKNHKINKNEWEECKQYFDYECAYCGLPIEVHYKTVGTDFHKEHVDADGSVFLDNCIPSCKSCNCSKWEYPINDWYSKDNLNFMQERLDKINQWIGHDYLSHISKKHLADLELYNKK